MTDVLARLVARALDAGGGLRPRLAARFEPLQGTSRGLQPGLRRVDNLGTPAMIKAHDSPDAQRPPTSRLSARGEIGPVDQARDSDLDMPNDREQPSEVGRSPRDRPSAEERPTNRLDTRAAQLQAQAGGGSGEPAESGLSPPRGQPVHVRAVEDGAVSAAAELVSPAREPKASTLTGVAAELDRDASPTGEAAPLESRPGRLPRQSTAAPEPATHEEPAPATPGPGQVVARVVPMTATDDAWAAGRANPASLLPVSTGHPDANRHVVRVAIGRIEVRAVTPPVTARSPRPAVRTSAPTLEAYLRARNGSPR